MTNLPPPNVNQAKSIICWNCGQDSLGIICNHCGCDVLNKPITIVDKQQAVINGAISGALIGALFSDKKHRVRNSVTAALWGASGASADAEYVNSAFASGAPLTAIHAHRKRRVAYYLGLALLWFSILMMTAAAATPGMAILTIPATWYTCKQLHKLTNWYNRPLYAYGIIKRRFGIWERGETIRCISRIEQRYKIYAVVFMILQTLMTASN